MRLHVLLLPCVLALAGCPLGPPETGAAKGEGSKQKDEEATERGWKGEFRGEKMTVTLEPKDGGALSGEITLEGKTYTLTAAAPKDGASQGTFESEGAKFDVSLKRSFDELELETGGTTYAMKRWIPPNPLAKKNPLARKQAPKADAQADPPKADPGTDDTATAGWKDYTHPRGLSMRHPPGWSVNPRQAGLLFMPADTVKNAQGQPLEIYLANAVPSEGVSDPASARAAQLLTQQVQADFPFLQPQGQPEKLSCRGGPGAIHTFGGTNPLGKATLAKVHVLVVDGIAVSLYAVGQADVLQKRLDTVRAMFQSYRFEKPAPSQSPAAPAAGGEIDPRLVGYWRHTSTYMSGSFSMVTDEHMVLGADGRCFWNSKSAGGMSHYDSGGNLTGTSSISSDGQGWSYRGTWSVSGSTLTMNWTSHGEREVHEFYVEGSDMMFKGSKNKLWKLIRR